MTALRFLLALFGIALAALLLWWLSAPVAVTQHRFAVTALPGWAEADLEPAFRQFRAACAIKPWRARAGAEIDIEAWQRACAAADQASPRRFFEQHFTAVEYRQGFGPAGFFTGYFLPELAGSRVASPDYPIPLYRRPPELVAVDLGAFRPELQGQRIAGRVEDGKLRPFPDRAAIEEGALSGRGLEITWVADPVEAFLLGVQGSGQVRFADGGVLRLGYDGQNGHPYRSIGRLLLEQRIFERDQLNLDSLVAWLREHPKEARLLMRQNPAYVFFRERAGEATGSLGLALVAGASLAVDPGFTPLGLPVWIATETGDGQTFQTLLLAADTGGAIKGAGRGDIFFGAGGRARALAAHQKMPGRFVMLAPR